MILLLILYLLEFEKYFETVAKGGIFVQVGMPAVADCDFKVNVWALVTKEIDFVGSNVGPRWCIKEMFDQHIRVKRGWFPMNPKMINEYKSK